MAAKHNPASPYWIAIDKDREASERRIIEGALRAYGGNVSRVSKALVLNRTHLLSIMKRLGIDREDFADTEVSP